MLLPFRHLLFTVAKRAASDPRVRAKAKQVFDENARPVLTRKARELKEVAAEHNPGEHPARFAGRAFRRLLDG